MRPLHRLRFSGSLVLFAGLQLLRAAGPYSAGFDDPTNAYDAPVPGFVGPQGDGNPAVGNVVNPLFFGWADRVVTYAPTADVAGGEWAVPERALGPVTGNHFDVVSLGELEAEGPPGSITLGFDEPIRNFSGADFVVFENAFGSRTSVFAELAYVEVSSDGVHFARFPSVSLTAHPVPNWGNLDPRNVFGLAGKHVNAYGRSWGTPFDLEALSGDPLVQRGDVDLNGIRYIRLIDIPGSGAFLDSEGRPIYDAYETFGSGGFDLEAVGVISRAMTFDTWAAQQLPAGLEGPEDDAREDGVPNLLAYALGRPGNLPGPRATLSLAPGGVFSFTRDERTVDLLVEVQMHHDLTQPDAWVTVAGSIGGAALQAAEGFEGLRIEERPASAIASVGVLREVAVSFEVPPPGLTVFRVRVTRLEEAAE